MWRRVNLTRGQPRFLKIEVHSTSKQFNNAHLAGEQLHHRLVVYSWGLG